jgi:hypothetical protein
MRFLSVLLLALMVGLVSSQTVVQSNFNTQIALQATANTIYQFALPGPGGLPINYTSLFGAIANAAAGAGGAGGATIPGLPPFDPNNPFGGFPGLPGASSSGGAGFGIGGNLFGGLNLNNLGGFGNLAGFGAANNIPSLAGLGNLAAPPSFNGLFGAIPGPNVTISSTAAGGATWSLTTVSNFGLTFGQANLPFGISQLAIGGQAQFGYNLSVSANVPITGTITFPALDSFTQVRANGSVGILTYNAQTQTYTRISRDFITVNADNTLSVQITGPGVYWLANVNFNPPPQPFPANPGVPLTFPLSAQSGQNFNFNFGAGAASAGGQIGANAAANANAVVLQIQNLIADAGQLAVAISANFTARAQLIAQAGRVQVSQIFNFTHSNGTGAVRSATLRYDLRLAVNGSFSVQTLKWYRFSPDANQWQVQGGTVNGAFLEFTATGFSEWSVQADPGNGTTFPTDSSSSSAGNAGNGGNGGNGGNLSSTAGNRNAANQVATASTIPTVVFAVASLLFVRRFLL